LLFYNEKGSPIDPDNLRKRHFTNVSKRRDCGKSACTTAATYGHLVPGENRQTVDQLDDQ
jgi:hypothetical protein